MEYKSQLIKTWFINNRVNMMLIDSISKEGMNCTLSKRGGRSVALQFAHMHNNRIYRLEKYGQEYLPALSRIDIDSPVTKSILKKNLIDSADVYVKWIEQAVNDGKIKGFKRGVIPMVGYFISHEAHHRGSILLTLKECGHPVPKNIRDNIWAWNQI